MATLSTKSLYSPFSGQLGSGQLLQQHDQAHTVLQVLLKILDATSCIPEAVVDPPGERLLLSLHPRRLGRPGLLSRRGCLGVGLRVCAQKIEDIVSLLALPPAIAGYLLRGKASTGPPLDFRLIYTQM